MFESITCRFQFKFKDRVTAAHILGEALKDRVSNKDQKNCVVLGIPRGGVITADIIAAKFATDLFDIIVPRKLTSPRNREQSVGAVMEDGTTYIIKQSMREMQLSSDNLEKEKTEQMDEIRRRTSLYCSRPRRDFGSFVKDRIVILVDDGASTGATVIATLKWINKLVYKPKLLIVAIPVAPKSTVKLLEEHNVEVEVVTSPRDHLFRSVEQYHQSFESVPDEHIIRITMRRNLLHYPMS